MYLTFSGKQKDVVLLTYLPPFAQFLSGDETNHGIAFLKEEILLKYVVEKDSTV